MLRTRLVWFTVGFGVSAAAFANLVWKDYWAQQYALSSHVKQKFEDLETRLINLESNPPRNSNHTPSLKV